MRKLIFILILIPIFLISSLNFYSPGNSDFNHPPYARAFTCTSCHATIIDDIIISGGKYTGEDETVGIVISFPDDIEYNTIQLNINEDLDDVLSEITPVSVDSYGEVYAISMESTKGNKKANNIKFEYKVPKDNRSNVIEVQGVLSNLDNEKGGDFSFFKKITIEKIEESRELKVFPTVVNKYLNIHNANHDLQLMDINGTVLLQKELSTSKEKIDFSNLPNGNYFLSLSNGKNVVQKKIIVRK